MMTTIKRRPANRSTLDKGIKPCYDAQQITT
uniref:Uncharacterized protein n=1 Tax=Podoviridae sp. ctlpi2 TaxID=2826574 RepID=A0A8S5MLM6_9CAUD|nr:MAG TPA: hypothetical protein [Podoviridae sp. ctlpi2]